LALERSLACLAGLKLRRDKGVEADDSIAVGGDEDAGRVGGLGAEGAIRDPAVELRLSAGKPLRSCSRLSGSGWR
jgi:hypothetical protein